MKLLIVEDDDNKRAHIRAFVDEEFPGWEVHEAVSLITALRAVHSIYPDIVLLDMALPNYDEGSATGSADILHFGGQEFLRQVRRASIDCRVIVVSQFETFGDPPNRKAFAQLVDELGSQFEGMFAGGVYYHASQSDWMEKLGPMLRGASNRGES